MSDVRTFPHRGALVGAAISGAFGAGWAQWGASGISGPTSVVIRATGMVTGLAIVIGSVWLWRSAPPEAGGPGGSMFSSPAYRLVVALETVALVGGGIVLNATGQAEYVVAWYATLVGIHFLAFGRLFWVGFYWLGAALIAAGAAGVAVGLAGGGGGAVKGISGLISAASLFAAGIRALVTARRSRQVV